MMNVCLIYTIGGRLDLNDQPGKTKCVLAFVCVCVCVCVIFSIQ